MREREKIEELRQVKIREDEKILEDEEEAWSKVTPVTCESPDIRSQGRRSSGKKDSFVKQNYSEGEVSDDCEIEVNSAGKRSNYTNTSVIVCGNNDDASSQNSAMSGGFAYLNSTAMKSKLRRQSTNTGSKKSLVAKSRGRSSDTASYGKVIRMHSASSDSEMAGLEMAGIDDDNQSGTQMRAMNNSSDEEDFGN